MVCPRCDQQGLIYKAKIVNLEIILHICDECDASWLENETINISNFKDLTIFLEENHLTYDITEIIDLGYINNNAISKRTFFNVPQDQIISLIDEAWLMKSKPLSYDTGSYIINMNRIIGTNRESIIKIIVKPGTAEIKTAYPIQSNS